MADFQKIFQALLEEYGNILGKGMRAKKSPAIYNPPNRPPRPFAADYPDYQQGAETDAVPLTRDIEGRPLRAAFVAGRRMVGGADEPIRPGDFDALAAATTGTSAKRVPASSMGGSFGRAYINPLTGKPFDMELLAGMEAGHDAMVYAHELGHAVDELAGQIPTKGIQKDLYHLYNRNNNPNRMYGNPSEPADWGKPFKPQHLDYQGDEAQRELMAEGVRTYMHDPNFLKTEYPLVAARIRETVNPSLRQTGLPQAQRRDLRDIIQFNALPAGAGLGAAGAGSTITLTPVDHDPFEDER